jgi:hypothetical protein
MTVGRSVQPQVRPNNSFKPKPLRSSKMRPLKNVPHFASTTQYKLIQALGNMRYILALAALVLVLPAYADSDRCSGRVPSELSRLLVQENPDYRLPKESDNLREDVEYNLSQKGSGCLALATADFDGNDQADFLVALPARDSKATLIAAALRHGKTWTIESLAMWPNSQGRVFVEAQPAGHFERTEALDGPASEPGEVLSMRCHHKAAIFGFTESSAVAYCRQAHNWQHVWVSD